MINEKDVKEKIISLLEKCGKLSSGDESEKRSEEFIRTLFEALGWEWLSECVIPQKKVRSALATTRVDYQFKKRGELRPSFYMEVKRFSNKLDNDARKQALDYGKNSGTRWVILTNFIKWRVFNSDYFDEPDHSELFEFNLSDCLSSNESMQWLLLLSEEQAGSALDEYAKKHKKWKESADIEEMLTGQLLEARRKLSVAIKEQNLMKFDTGQNMEESIDYCVQTILDRIIFCRMLEDCGGDPDRKLRDVVEKWSNDQRLQFYKDFLCPFFLRMHDKYDSTIFDHDRVDRLSIKNDDFMPVLESFYVHPKTKLKYYFDLINTDILGHAYENYLSWRATAKKKGIEEDLYKRKQSGIYYTPKFLVDFLVRSTLGERLAKCKTPDEALKIRVLDPACGSGTFLVRALEEFKSWFSQYESRRGKKSESAAQTHFDSTSATYVAGFIDKVLENCIYGIDLDPRAVRLARLNLFLRSVNTPKQLPQLNIIEKNSLVWDNDDPKAFSIERDFPLVAEAGGFDVVVGNPPWEKWKPDSQEFFEPFDPGFKKLSAQEAKKRAGDLLKKPFIKKLWQEKLNTYEMYSTVFRESYKWQSAEVNGRMVSGDLDLYKLFTERAHQLLKDGGLAGFVVPSGVYTDLGAKGLRTMLFEHSQIKALYSFENRGHAIFPDVHASYKPILLAFQKGGTTKSFPCAFFLHSAEDLHKAIENPTILDVDFVKKSSPNSWNILEIKTPEDFRIVRKLLKHPPLGEKISEAWNVNISRGFDMTNDSHLFKIGLAGVPMLEGKNIHQFTHKFIESPVPRYKVLEKDIEEKIKSENIYHKEYWMAYRLIARSTDTRTFISTIVPPGYVCGNSIAIVRLPALKQICFLAGIMNSFVIDYFMRQKVSANVNMFYFLETPVPRLSSGKEFDFVVRKVAQLVCTTNEFSGLKKVAGIEYGLTKENERALARAQLDAMVAKIYGVTEEEMKFILQRFPNVDGKQKEMILEQW